MNSRIRRAALALVAAAGLITAPVLVSASASAADLTGVQLVFFSNPAFTDVDEEDVALADGLAGAEILYFDGGDGSASAWENVLAGQTILVLPEMDNDYVYVYGGTSAMSDDAAAAVGAWVNAGGTIVAADPYGIFDLLNVVGATSAFNDSIFDTSGSPWALLQPIDGLPATLSEVNAIDGFDTTAITGVTNVPLYGTGDVAVVNQFSFGSGFAVTLGYDWYPDEDDIAEGRTAEWNAVLQYIVATHFSGAEVPAEVPAAAPTLPNTGSSAPAAELWIGAALLVALGGALLVARSRMAGSRR